MTKNELKSIVKECVLEILAEGLASSLNEVSQKKKSSQQLIEKREMEQKTLQRRRAVADSISMATNNPVLQDVFAHTAKTTLQEQMAKELPSMMGGMQQHAGISEMPGDPGLDINSIFGDASKNWSAAAFGIKKMPGN